MPYEIPQQLQYQEKIIFGLNFKQLLYALIFFPIGLILFLKTNFSLSVKIILGSIPILIGILFMFCDLSHWASSVWQYLKFREVFLMDLKMKNFLGLKKIENGIIHLKNKKLALLKIEPINFAIRNNEEKEVITKGFQKFLNSLDFPIQLAIGTEILNIDNYLNSLQSRVDETVKKTNNILYKTQYEAYKQHLIEHLDKSQVLNRSFYLIIPESKEIGLEVQINVCLDNLKSLDLQAKQITDNEELTQTIAGFFNNLLTDDDKSNLADEKIDNNNLLHYLIAPKFILNHKDCIQVNDKLVRTISAVGYPRSVEVGFMDKIVTTSGDFDISLHIEPFAIETMMLNLNKELQKQRADLFAAQTKNIVNPSLEIKYHDTKNVLENLQKGNEKLFNVSLYVNCKAKNENGLNLLSKKVESELNSIMIVPKSTPFRMAQGIKSVAPFGIDELNIKRNVTTSALSAFFPFTSKFLQVDDKGVWMGLNKNSIPIIKDIFSFSNPNGVIMATSGAGKSYLAKLFIARQLLNGTKVMVIDPQSEYVKLAETYGGQVVTISRTSETIINPLDLMGHDYAEKRLALMDLIPAMLGTEETSEIQKSVIDKALTIIYTKKGITNDPKTWNNQAPIISDLVDELKNMSKHVTAIERPTYNSLINRLSLYVDGAFSFLNKQTNIDFDKSFVVFNIGDMPKQVKPVVMFLILDYVYMKMKKDKERKLLIIDEAWSLLARAEDSSYIFEIVKTCRKFNLGLLLITQDVADLLNSQAGNAVLANSSYTLLLRQKPAVIDKAGFTFHLSSGERNKLLTAGVGEGIIIMENEHSEIKIIASKQEHDLITTNPDELLVLEKKDNNIIERKNVNANVDSEKGFFRKRGLSDVDINYLLKKDYVILPAVSLKGGRQENYLLKPRHNESPIHFFLCKSIEECLKNHTQNIELYETTKPDIIFDVDKKRFAIEVETGSGNERDLEIKVKQLKKEFGDNWFFVVTDSTLKQIYGRWGRTLIRSEVEQMVEEIFKKKACVSEKGAGRGDFLKKKPYKA